MEVKIKICGITRYEDARVAINLGVDALGFIFYEKSPRHITPARAGAIIAKLPPFVAKVGVFVDAHPAAIMDAAQESGIDTVQLHGNETPDIARRLPFTVIKAFPVGPDFDPQALESWDVAGFLLDTWDDSRKGGTGKSFDWSTARTVVAEHKKNVILAGGLGPVNIREALDAVRPYAVDFNSGVEIKPGVKNPHKMKDAVGIVKAWE
ncbi:MAG: phosphoribosylanthranilate isomerase [Chitinivibrionales bacterium]|nr:phosphoribosylanthranilate isomerase [Chitinivibrionales bacterium]MBD3394913.1 phosphoribosylanthranilate isomerase [Chitinivibrionales bacterium]